MSTAIDEPSRAVRTFRKLMRTFKKIHSLDRLVIQDQVRPFRLANRE